MKEMTSFKRNLDYGAIPKDRTDFDSYLNTDKFREKLLTGDEPLDCKIQLSILSIRKTREKCRILFI